MAVSRWRQMRIWALERATLQSAMEAHDPNEIDPATRVALSFRNLADDSRTLDLLHRYETRFDRQFARSFNLLIKLARPDGGAGVSSCGTPVPHPGGTPAPHPGPESESRPEDAPPLCDPSPAPEEDFCQTNPSSGAGHACGSVSDLPACGTPAPHPGGTPVPHPGASSRAADSETEDAVALPPENDFCQTNLIPISDTVDAIGCSDAQHPTGPPVRLLTLPSPDSPESSLVFMDLNHARGCGPSRQIASMSRYPGALLKAAASATSGGEPRV